MESSYFPGKSTGIRPYHYDCKRLTHRHRAIFHDHGGITVRPFTRNVRTLGLIYVYIRMEHHSKVSIRGRAITEKRFCESHWNC